MMQLLPTDALLVIDMQNDFCPGGTLPVTGGNEVVPLINILGHHFEHVIFTQDWHPVNHISFAVTHPGKRPLDTIEVHYGTQALWPAHCVQGSTGAALHPALDLPHAELLLRKGFRRQIDSYSAFLENDRTTPTGLAGYLHERAITRLFCCGLAYDFCVQFSAIDGQHLGFEMAVIEDATRAVYPANDPQTKASLQAAGALVIHSSELLP
jgi:nicotinamidase/pyrazinamidase